MELHHPPQQQLRSSGYPLTDPKRAACCRLARGGGDCCNQSTHSRVANSTASMLRHGPRRRITSVLKRPLLLDAVRPTGERVVIRVTDAADRGFNTGFEQALCVPTVFTLGRVDAVLGWVR